MDSTDYLSTLRYFLVVIASFIFPVFLTTFYLIFPLKKFVLVMLLYAQIVYSADILLIFLCVLVTIKSFIVLLFLLNFSCHNIVFSSRHSCERNTFIFTFISYFVHSHSYNLLEQLIVVVSLSFIAVFLGILASSFFPDGLLILLSPTFLFRACE